MEIGFGIDFGTTNSACVGILKNKRDIKYTDGYDAPFPSVVVIDKITGEVYCGREAWNRRQEFSEACEVITSIKSYLGTDHRWHAGGETWTPEMVAAQVFWGLKQQVLSTSGDVNFNSAVVAVPVGFSAAKRESLRKAAKYAGIEITEFVSESTSAVFHNYQEIKHYSRIAVFDWGGGTLDISILENISGAVKEIATGGEQLGGDDIDLKIAKWAHNKIIQAKGDTVSFEEIEPRYRDLLIARAERAKKDLSYTESVQIRLNKYGNFGAVNVVLDIDTFSKLIQPEVTKAVEFLNKILAKAKISMEELGCILLVGGSINLRPFLDETERSWSCLKIFPEESEWSVAYGAARLKVEKGKYRLAETIGLALSDGSFYPMLNEKETLFSERGSHKFSIVDDTDSANFVVKDINDRVLGYFSVPVMGFFQEEIILKAIIDKNLVLWIEAKSNRKGAADLRKWSYSTLKFYYELPKTTEVRSIGA